MGSKDVIAVPTDNSGDGVDDDPIVESNIGLSDDAPSQKIVATWADTATTMNHMDDNM